MFDSTQKNVFSTVQTLFGDAAVWVPSTGGASQIVSVLFNSPETKQSLGDVEKYEYSPYKFWIEYFIDQYTTLKANVDNGLIEIVTIKGIAYYVKEVSPKFDGKTIIAFLEPNNS